MEFKTNTNLCAYCKTGYDTYMRDNKSLVCPYLSSHNGQSCGYFVKMDITEVTERLPDAGE